MVLKWLCMLPIKDEEESCDEKGPPVLPEPPEEVIVTFLGEKVIDKLVTSISDSDKDLWIPGWIFPKIYFLLDISKKGSNSRGSLCVRLDERDWVVIRHPSNKEVDYKLLFELLLFVLRFQYHER